MGFVLVWIAFFHSPVIAEDTNNGKDLFSDRCAVCHGEYGQVSNNVIPNILGQYPAYLLTQMQAFLSDDPKSSRGGVAGELKRSILLDLSVQDIKDIIDFWDNGGGFSLEKVIREPLIREPGGWRSESGPATPPFRVARVVHHEPRRSPRVCEV